VIDRIQRPWVTNLQAHFAHFGLLMHAADRSFDKSKLKLYHTSLLAPIQNPHSIIFILHTCSAPWQYH
jgi:hypothetical protein